MKKIVVVFLVLFLLVGCSTNDVDDSIKVVVSFGLLEEVVNTVGGDKVSVTNIVGNSDAHVWEPTPRDSVILSNADLIVIVGAGFEHWFDSVAKTIDLDKVVDTSADIDLIINDGVVDPHLWMDPLNVIQQAKTVMGALVEIDEENKDYYLANFEKYKSVLLELDNAYREHNLNGTIVSSHASFGYLAQAYGLDVLSVDGLEPSVEPSIGKITFVIDEIRRQGIKYIFFDNIDDTKVADMIANEAGIKARLLSPLEMMESDYKSMMLENLEVLDEAFGQ